jgi:hypothetical protein
VAAVTGGSLWLVILVPVLAISWVGFYTIARAVGVPPLFAMGMSAAFDGVAIFAARTGLKHRRKGFSGYLARITVLMFVALGVFVQSFHSDTTTWVHNHAWVVWAVAPIAAAICYELHLGWIHRKQLIKHGYTHPSAKSGYGPATWLMIGGTLREYRNGLRARRDFISATNLARFRIEEDEQPVIPPAVPPKPALKPRPRPRPQPKPELQGPPGPRLVHSTRPASKRRAVTENMKIAAWCREQGIQLGYRDRVPAEGLRRYRAAHPSTSRAAA